MLTFIVKKNIYFKNILLLFINNIVLQGFSIRVKALSYLKYDLNRFLLYKYTPLREGFKKILTSFKYVN